MLEEVGSASVVAELAIQLAAGGWLREQAATLAPFAGSAAAAPVEERLLVDVDPLAVSLPARSRTRGRFLSLASAINPCRLLFGSGWPFTQIFGSTIFIS